MNKMGKFALFLALFVGIASYSFGEVYFSFTTGLYRFIEQYPEEKYSRELDGLNIILTVNYYPADFPFGIYVQASFGDLTSGYEFNENEMEAVDINSIDNIQFSIGSSLKLPAGKKIRFPISIGPVVTFNREENYDDLSGKTTFYDAINLGALGDVSIIMNPSRWFFIKSGVSLVWDFIHVERGQMKMNFRETSDFQYKRVSYSAYTPSIYMGIGIRFD